MYAEREAEAERIDKMYEDVEDAVIAALIAAYLTGLPRTVYAETQSAKVIIYDAYAQTQIWNREAIPELYGEQVELSRLSLPVIEQASDARFRAMTETAARRLDDLAANFDVATARREALKGFLKANWGLSTKELASEMERTLRESGITGFTDAAGRKWKLRTYAEMAARTTTMDAEVSGIKDRVISEGGDLVRIVGPLDYPDGCPPSVLGGPYSITGATKVYQDRPIMTLDQAIAFYGVFHPRCRHSLAQVG